MRIFSSAAERNPYRQAEKQPVKQPEPPKKNLRSETFLVYVDNIPTVNMEVNEEDTIGDIKNTLKKYIGTREEMDIFLNRKAKLDMQAYNNPNLGPVWKHVDSPSIFINHRGYPVKPMYGYPNPKYEEIFYSNDGSFIRGDTTYEG